MLLLSKELLENGVIIRPNGTLRKKDIHSIIKKGEWLLFFSKDGVRGEFKNDGIGNMPKKKKRILIHITQLQAKKFSHLADVYYRCFSK